MTEKEKEILEKAEDVMLAKINGYLGAPEKMTDKDCYDLQIFVITLGRIRAIKEGKTLTASY